MYTSLEGSRMIIINYWEMYPKNWVSFFQGHPVYTYCGVNRLLLLLLLLLFFFFFCLGVLGKGHPDIRGGGTCGTLFTDLYFSYGSASGDLGVGDQQYRPRVGVHPRSHELGVHPRSLELRQSSYVTRPLSQCSLHVWVFGTQIHVTKPSLDGKIVPLMYLQPQ